MAQSKKLVAPVVLLVHNTVSVATNHRRTNMKHHRPKFLDRPTGRWVNVLIALAAGAILGVALFFGASA
jgi:hypothetical protein